MQEIGTHAVMDCSLGQCLRYFRFGKQHFSLHSFSLPLWRKCMGAVDFNDKMVCVKRPQVSRARFSMRSSLRRNSGHTDARETSGSSPSTTCVSCVLRSISATKEGESDHNVCGESSQEGEDILQLWRLRKLPVPEERLNLLAGLAHKDGVLALKWMTMFMQYVFSLYYIHKMYRFIVYLWSSYSKNASFYMKNYKMWFVSQPSWIYWQPFWRVNESGFTLDSGESISLGFNMVSTEDTQTLLAIACNLFQEQVGSSKTLMRIHPWETEWSTESLTICLARLALVI